MELYIFGVPVALLLLALMGYNIIRRLQRKVSRKYEMNKTKLEGGEARYNKTKNIIKTEKRIKLIHRRLANIRLNNIHQITTSLVKTKPQSIVIDRDLNAAINLSKLA